MVWGKLVAVVSFWFVVLFSACAPQQHFLGVELQSLNFSCTTGDLAGWLKAVKSIRSDSRSLVSDVIAVSDCFKKRRASQ